MFNVKAYPAILEKTKQGYSLFFPDLPGAVSAGKDYEDAIQHAKECLSLHIYGMLEDKEVLPEPTQLSKVMKKLDPEDLVALVEPDIFALKVCQEDSAVRVNITLPKSLLEAIDAKEIILRINYLSPIQKVTREAI